MSLPIFTKPEIHHFDTLVTKVLRQTSLRQRFHRPAGTSLCCFDLRDLTTDEFVIEFQYAERLAAISLSPKDQIRARAWLDYFLRAVERGFNRQQELIWIQDIELAE